MKTFSALIFLRPPLKSWWESDAWGWGFALHQTPVILPLLELKTIPSLSFLAFPSSEVRTPFCSLQLLWDSESGPQTAWLIIRGATFLSVSFELYFWSEKKTNWVLDLLACTTKRIPFINSNTNLRSTAFASCNFFGSPFLPSFLHIFPVYPQNKIK